MISCLHTYLIAYLAYIMDQRIQISVDQAYMDVVRRICLKKSIFLVQSESDHKKRQDLSCWICLDKGNVYSRGVSNLPNSGHPRNVSGYIPGQGRCFQFCHIYFHHDLFLDIFSNIDVLVFKK